MNIKNGFTLAEVLITLGIIGIVAALTMPSLIQNSKRQETSARLKKFYSTMSQALIMAELDNGPIKDWPKTEMIYNDEGEYDKEANSNVAHNFFNNYLVPYFKYISAKEDPDYNNYIKIILQDGSYFHVRNGSCIDITFDTNGNKRLNKLGSDKFVFVICGKNIKAAVSGHFSAYCPKATKCSSRAQAIQSCEEDANYCAGILQLDNWEIKNDYPRKL